MNWISIDPGIQGTGYAVWDYEVKLHKCGVINAPSKYTWEEKMRYVALALTEYNYSCNKIYIEYPQRFGGASGDMVSLKGDLGKLFTCVGYILGYLKCDFKLISVVKWKGQLPKKIVNARIQKLLNKEELGKLSKNKSHDWDAVGIGLYVQGRL